MPNAYIKKLSDEGKGSEDELEKKWKKAKELAQERGREDDYAYVTGIFKKMIGEDLTLREFLKWLIFEEGEPTTSVGAGGVDIRDKPLEKPLARRKKKKKKEVDKSE
jgi:hypothetical protein